MATSQKKIGLYALVGFAAAIILIAALFATGIQFPGFSSNESGKTGTLSVSIMDAPTNLTHLNVTINALYTHNQDNDSWIKLNFTGGLDRVYFDLLALSNLSKDLSTSPMPVGNYSKIRLSIESANATLEDETTMNLTVPPGHIDITVSFRINAEKTTNVLIDMQTDSTSISKKGNLKPVLKATVQYLS
jgi:hypothetical protein